MEVDQLRLGETRRSKDFASRLMTPLFSAASLTSFEWVLSFAARRMAGRVSRKNNDNNMEVKDIVYVVERG
jgi:hypothetical protein